MQAGKEVYFKAQDGERAIVFSGIFSRYGCQLHGEDVRTYWSYQVRKPSGKFTAGSGCTLEDIQNAIAAGSHWEVPRGEQRSLVGKTRADYPATPREDGADLTSETVE